MSKYRTFEEIEEEYLRNHPEEVDDLVLELSGRWLSWNHAVLRKPSVDVLISLDPFACCRIDCLISHIVLQFK